MKKYFNISYLLPILVIIIFLIGISACDSRLGKPDIRDEYNQDKKPDYWGYRWDFKW